MKKVIALLIALSMMLCACDTVEDKSNDTVGQSSTKVENTDKGITDNTTKSQTEKLDISMNTDFESFDTANIFYNESSYQFSDNKVTTLNEILSNLQPVDIDSLTVFSSYQEWKITTYDSFNVTSYTRTFTSNGYMILDSDMNLYPDSEELLQFISQCNFNSNDDNSSITSNGEYYSIECDEPNTEDEYRDTAVECVRAWLKSMQGDDVDDYYRNDSFTIASTEKNNYLSCGYVNGRKEFVVEVCFTTKEHNEDISTFYDSYFQEGRYTEAGTFWSGNYICGRFTWEDGRCSLIDMTTRDSSKSIQDGLNGIQQGEYANFYEFARREDLQQAIEDSFIDKPLVMSKNLTITKEGNPINIDIYCREDTIDNGDTYQTEAHFCTYMNGQQTYSTGVYFYNNETGVKILELPKEFSLTFDNYDGDANPDYAVKYDEDENGSYYVLESVQSDGRVFNYSGRAYEGGIYVAGCFDASPRLQKTDNIKYVGWIFQDGKYIPTDENGNETELPEVNIYSDRLYLPDTLKLYEEDENSVTCFAWNNTDSEVSTDNKFDIEMYSGGQWKTISKDISVDTKTIAPREYVEITYDISTLKDRIAGKYRFVQQCDDYTAYGEFYLAGKENDVINITCSEVPKGATCGNFTISNMGINDIKISNVMLLHDGKEYPLEILNSENIVKSETDVEFSYILKDSVSIQDGKYSILINDSQQADINVIDTSKSNNLITVETERLDNGINLKVTNNANEDILYISPIVLQRQDNVWNTIYLTDQNYSYDYATIESGKSIEFNLVDDFRSYIDDEEFEEYYELIIEELKEDNELAEQLQEYGMYPDITIDEFKKLMIDKYCYNPNNEMLITLEYSINDEEFTSIIRP